MQLTTFGNDVMLGDSVQATVGAFTVKVSARVDFEAPTDEMLRVMAIPDRFSFIAQLEAEVWIAVNGYQIRVPEARVIRHGMIVNDPSNQHLDEAATVLAQSALSKAMHMAGSFAEAA
ncbi:hypothetical protein [Halomonas sp. PA16-9]|jgi:hypothetical protein|uniref:hypothetical protein n=1 Tax=Halomonas sp. PA16-9 TaxID=2576841 RepID=UPI0012DA36F5|nr:hypothetical protein FDY98_25100 [Halomonas sp. PA16-9]|tara:strand:+ start:1211 stop:1564 length:354 start_codon:yes stop_codon:yes gene_type:complete